MFHEHNMNEQELEDYIDNSQGVIVLDFYAKWCQPCKQLAAQIEVTEIPHDIKVLKVDVEENENIAKRFLVRSVPTLVMLDDDCLSSRISTSDIKQVIKWIEDNV